jgi:hypothetical protein
MGFAGPEWEKRIVAQCDLALNDWRARIPGHRESYLHSFLHVGMQTTIQFVGNQSLPMKCCFTNPHYFISNFTLFR